MLQAAPLLQQGPEFVDAFAHRHVLERVPRDHHVLERKMARLTGFMDKMLARANGYPKWICAGCGERVGTIKPGVACFHEPDLQDRDDVCGWCGSNCHPLTEPRDYGYPPLHASQKFG